MDSSDDGFSDDGFDSLPAGTLLELEQSAWQATQAPPRNQIPDVVPRRNVGTFNAASLLKPAPLQRQASSLYENTDLGDWDAEILEDNNKHVETLAQFDPRGTHDAQPGNYRGITTVEAQHFAQPTQRPYIAVTEEQHLRTRIEEISRNHESTIQEIASAKEDATRKSGEVAILRAKLANQEREYERTISGLRAQLAEQTAKNQGAQQAAIDDRQRLQTENLFLRDELRGETLRANNLRVRKQAEEKNAPSTPRKQRTLPYRDGFDDDEIGMMSPTKSSGGRSKRGTPSAHGKRKRKASDAPVPMPSLQLSPANNMSVEAGSPSLGNETTKKKTDILERDDNSSMRYMSRILNHKTPPNTEPDFEVMARTAFPSDPTKMISSVVLEKMRATSANYAVNYAICLVDLWKRSLTEKFYEPVPLFMASIEFILLLDLYTIGPKLASHLTLAIQNSVLVNAVPRFEHSPVSSKTKGESRRTPRKLLEEKVDSTKALEILYLLALACQQDDESYEALWGNVHFDILLMSLNAHQPLQDIILILRILSTSLRPGAFGTIQPSEAEQRQVEQHFIERATSLLTERVNPDEGAEEYLPSQICQMHMEILSFLEMLTFYNSDIEKGPAQNVILSHELVLPRLFRRMYEDMDCLYTLRPEHNLRTALVNREMHLIYELIRKGGGQDLTRGLSRLSGARQKHRLVLSRLAFSEGQFLESGISEETMEMARQLLEEEDMSPEEAEALFEAFPNQSAFLSGREASQIS
ncbi:Stress response protein NST1 [Talaromyces islandicus]|uniref:Stress response protein NST1 n=1 Tax=Talaromyces islandicus TaxID=28573 RepID=A0A0U1LJI0_TALIS|nr:Stress response protein NST1 [Talaromyces islandicus]